MFCDVGVLTNQAHKSLPWHLMCHAKFDQRTDRRPVLRPRLYDAEKDVCLEDVLPVAVEEFMRGEEVADFHGIAEFFCMASGGVENTTLSSDKGIVSVLPPL